MRALSANSQSERIPKECRFSLLKRTFVREVHVLSNFFLWWIDRSHRNTFSAAISQCQSHVFLWLCKENVLRGSKIHPYDKSRVAIYWHAFIHYGCLDITLSSQPSFLSIQLDAGQEYKLEIKLYRTYQHFGFWAIERLWITTIGSPFFLFL